MPFWHGLPVSADNKVRGLKAIFLKYKTSVLLKSLQSEILHSLMVFFLVDVLSAHALRNAFFLSIEN